MNIVFLGISVVTVVEILISVNLVTYLKVELNVQRWEITHFASYMMLMVNIS